MHPLKDVPTKGKGLVATRKIAQGFCAKKPSLISLMATTNWAVNSYKDTSASM
jgi:hypothetical protein